ncbi:MAG TPA: alpha/beta fold hydrolase [Burkholderiales bacterium]|nr:alpha/beta fold hydrolase [Burkholderiales bacterium]
MIDSTYQAPRWLPGGHAQTIYASLFSRVPRVAVRREQWDTPDGDFIEVDCLDGVTDAPLLVMFHGLEGSGQSHYARAMLHAAKEAGWRMLLPHFRGCGGTPNKLPRAYHSGDSAEADWILRRAHGLTGAADFYAIGVSLGGNVLLKWLGEEGPLARDIVSAAAAVSAPVDLHAAGTALEKGFSKLYTRMFLASLIDKSLAMLNRYPGLFDREKLRRASSLRDFDNVVTAPLHGFIDAADYWTRSSSKPFLDRIAVPTLVINALNDPFLPAAALPRVDEVSSAVTLEYPAAGGHVGFVSPPFPGRLTWLPARIIEHLQKAKSS